MQKIEKLVEEIEKLSVIELADLVKAIEAEFGVTAAAPVAGVVAAPAEEAAAALFAGGANMSNVPTVNIAKEDIGSPLLDILANTKIVPSKKEGRRLIEQGGLSLNGVKVTDVTRTLNDEDFEDGVALIKRGKKNYNKIVVK